MKKYFFNRYAFLIIGILLYVHVIGLLGGIEPWGFYKAWIEWLLLLYLYTLFYFILRPTRWRALIAALPILVAYFIQDAYFFVYGKVLRVIEITELPELLQVITAGQALMIFVLFILPLAVVITRINYAQIRRLLLGLLPTAMLLILIVVSPTAYTNFVKQLGNGIVLYSDAGSVENNGRINMLLYNEAERRNSLLMTQPYHNREQYNELINSKVTQLAANSTQQNIHILVLESFLDPRLFEGLKFNREPVHNAFKKIFGAKTNLSLSPVFGGATAQAEFEVLCGVPALEKLSSVEFNAFTGAPAYCLPGIMNKLGYQTVASNAYKPDFFNAEPAYRGIGFSNIYFPVEYTATNSSYLTVKNAGVEKYLFDEDLLQQNLDYIKQHLSNTDRKPLLNYIMTIYGHTPHILDLDKRPEIIKLISSYPDDHLQRSVNQFYYRTEAIATYINELIRIDKNSLIILVSDHVPPLRNGPNTYRALQYLSNVEKSYFYNPLMIIENGKVKNIRRIRHFDLPDLVYNYVTTGEYCLQTDCSYLSKASLPERESYVQDYFLLMSHASE
jgi:phosphoglycerol transferase MdoB-like AlkP superfamily enzyme